MKIFFPCQSNEDVIDKIKSKMGGRKINDIVQFESLDAGLNIVIKSMGTSKLIFDRQDDKKEICFTLTKEKIALTHRAFKDGLTDKLVKIIEEAGGRVES